MRRMPDTVMKLRIDQEADALYLRLDESTIVESEEVRPGFILDFDEMDRVVGIEIPNLSKMMAQDIIRTFQIETLLT